MSEADGQRLRELLRLRVGTDDILNNRENSRIEFKQSFNMASLAGYVRTMIGFANNRGGFLVFGVEASPHRLRGVDLDRFEGVDPAQISSFLRDHVGPSLEWDVGSIEFAGVSLGYMSVEESNEKPAMVTKDSGGRLKHGEIYYRYSGQTRIIAFAEIRSIIDERLERERRAWMQHLQAISRAGPTNVGILDTLHGELYGGDATFLIDESLIEKLKFIRQGSFSEQAGTPTLRLVGDLHEVSSVVTTHPVPTGIHMTDLLAAFLTQRQLSQEEARSYLEEVAFQNSPMCPVFWFARSANLGAEQAADVVAGPATPYENARKRIVDRLRGFEQLEPSGTKPPDREAVTLDSPHDLVRRVDEARRPLDKRGVLVMALLRSPAVVAAAIRQLPVVRVCEALTHVDAPTIREKSSSILVVGDALLRERYGEMTANERSTFRRAVAYLDQQMSV